MLFLNRIQSENFQNVTEDYMDSYAYTGLPRKLVLMGGSKGLEFESTEKIKGVKKNSIKKIKLTNNVSAVIYT